MVELRLLNPLRCVVAQCEIEDLDVLCAEKEWLQGARTVRWIAFGSQVVEVAMLVMPAVAVIINTPLRYNHIMAGLDGGVPRESGVLGPLLLLLLR